MSKGTPKRTPPEGLPPDGDGPILRAADLSRFSAIDVDPARESESRVDYDDGGVHIRYVYRFDASDGVFVSSLLNVDVDEKEAESTFQEYLSRAADMGVAIERDDRLSWGDASAMWAVTVDGEQVGHAILARKGMGTLFVIFSGYLFAGETTIRELIEPKLEALEALSRDGT